MYLYFQKYVPPPKSWETAPCGGHLRKRGQCGTRGQLGDDTVLWGMLWDAETHESSQQTNNKLLSFFSTVFSI